MSVEPWTMVTDDDGLRHASELIAAGHGPFGVDTERASGFRYGNRAYLVQVFRRGSGTFLFDPIDITDFSPLAAALTGDEWVLHSADQDLPSLAEIGLAPETLFDTELGSRLLGLDRVGLGAVTAELLGIENNGNDYLASVKFTGQIKPAPDALAEPFNEVWNLVKPVSGAGGWLLGGIQQLA